MLLGDLLRAAGIKAAVPPGAEIVGLTADSRAVKPGDLFVALPGSRFDGRHFAADAVRDGAAAVLAGRNAPPDLPGDVPLLLADDPRRAFALMAATLHPGQPSTIAAVTGTNGKSSVVGFLRQIWSFAGHRAASLGTLGLVLSQGNTEDSTSDDSDSDTPDLTTPDPVSLHHCLDQLAARGIDSLAVEASSHGLDQRRLDGVRLAAAGFTYLGRDHLDYHTDTEAYRAAKLRLFKELLPSGAAIVANAGEKTFASLRGIAERRGLSLVSYGVAGGDVGSDFAVKTPDVFCRQRTADGEGWELVLEFGSGSGSIGHSCTTGFPAFGVFQIENLLCALALAIACGVDAADAGRAVAHLQGAPGRMQIVARRPTVVVDYAHTPDALAAALKAARLHTTRRLAVVFGCGGDRDPGKRPQMGAVAGSLADRIIVTDDNPRGEDPAMIRAAIRTGIGADSRSDPGSGIEILEEGDRARAIAAGLEGLGPEDFLLVAGKGHETVQIVGGEKFPFCDATMAAALHSEQCRENR